MRRNWEINLRWEMRSGGGMSWNSSRQKMLEENSSCDPMAPQSLELRKKLRILSQGFGDLKQSPEN